MMEVPETHLAGDSPRQYHHFALSNGLKCCVISDPSADKAAAAIAVAAGQLQDTAPGIAHLTEHMLFMGSKTYPAENEYDQYMQQNGGHSNAYTDLEVTCFYFDVISETVKFTGALDRLACALSEPLIAVSSLERELQAVDSEHAKNQHMDHWRLHQLSRNLLGQKNTAKQHAFANFGTGNKESLLQIAGNENENLEHKYETLRQQMLQFYKQHYTAANMTLSVLGSQSIQELQGIVEEIFAKLPAGDASSSSPVPSLPISETVKVVQWVPLRKECALLDLQWVIPTQWDNYKEKPGRFWSHLLGHEGPGTLLAVLRDKQWAQELVADDVSTNCRSFSLFHINIELTAAGLQHVIDVLKMLFHYIDNVLAKIPDWVYDELKVTGDTSFRFLSKHDAADTCSGMAVHMHQFEPEHYPSGSYKLYKYDPVGVLAIGECLRSKNEKNLLICLGSANYEEITDQVDEWYGTKYRIVPSSDPESHVWTQLQERMKSKDESPTLELAFPARNDMLPTNFSLVADTVNAATSERFFGKDGLFAKADSPPRCLVDTDTCRLWYKPDINYQSPKVNFLATFRSPIMCDGTPETYVLASFWVEVATELCNEFSYAASMAGLHCGFQDTKKGMELHVSGYNHKAGVLLQRICDTLVAKLPEKLSSSDDNAVDFFERLRDKLEQQYHAALSAQPYQHAPMAADLVLEAANKGLLQRRIEYVTDKKLLTSDVLLHFSNQLLSRFKLEVLAHGNVTPQEAKEWTNIILDSFKSAPPLRLPALRGVTLPFSTDSECIFRLKGWNEHDENSCVVNIYQIGPIDIPTNALLSVLLHLLREPAFNVLRTDEQLGYVVFTSVKTNADNVKSLMFLIQSDSFDPINVDKRIENFLRLFREKILVEMSADDFQANVEAVCESLLEKNKNLSEESNKMWSVITNRSYHFRRLQDIAESARHLTKVDILRFFDRYILTDSPYRRKLSVQLFGTAHESLRQNLLSVKTSAAGLDSGILIESPDDFVNGQSLFSAQKVASVEDYILDGEAVSVEA